MATCASDGPAVEAASGGLVVGTDARGHVVAKLYPRSGSGGSAADSLAVVALTAARRE